MMDPDEVILDDIRNRFVQATGTEPIRVEVEQAGPEQFLTIVVGRDAPLYSEGLLEINQQLTDRHPFYGRLQIRSEPAGDILQSPEIELLRSLIGRSLVVSPATAESRDVVSIAPFRGHQDIELMQQANHIVIGRRGVGKSSLIMATVKKLQSRGDLTVWIDMQRYHRRDDLACVAQLLDEILASLVESGNADHEISDLRSRLSAFVARQDPAERDIRILLPRLALAVRRVLKMRKRQMYVFLDDFHLVAPTLQPSLIDMVYSMARGSGVWLKLACVRNLAVFYDSEKKLGLNVPQDAQLIELDQTLVDPLAARDHVIAVLMVFLRRCGFDQLSSLVGPQAVERLVWSSAGVPRDCLSLFSSALREARAFRHKKVGVQDVNLAAGEFAAIRMQQLAAETSGSEEAVQAALEAVQHFCLDERKKNAFLVLQKPDHPGFKSLAVLMDLRFVHLLHPSITTDRAGVRYQAYLLDYSFYTGMRRRQHIEEIRIQGDRPKREELRRLPRLDLDRLVA
jgi:hypothetical protein